MTIETKMTDRAPDTQDHPHPAQPDADFSPSRRKLTGAALGVSAVFTLASRPVLANVCRSPSGFVSGNLSQHGAPLTCSGRSPGYWKEAPDEWPTTTYAPGAVTQPATSRGKGSRNQPESWSGGTLFHPFFAGSQFMADIDGNPTTSPTSLSMMQVMHLNNGSNPWGLTDPDNLGAHIVAALLNAATNKTTGVLPDTLVIAMWNEWLTKGYFEPTAGVQWDADLIVKYIKTTFS